MNEECVEHPLPDLEFYKWYQVCLTYNHRKSEDKRSHLVNLNLYFDGKFVKSGKTFFTIVAEKVPKSKIRFTFFVKILVLKIVNSLTTTFSPNSTFFSVAL